MDPARLEETARLIPDELARRLVSHNTFLGPVDERVRQLRDLAAGGADFALLDFPGRRERMLPAAAEIAAAFVA